MAARVGSIYVALNVDVGQMGKYRSASNVIDRESRRMRTALGSTSTSVHSLRRSMNAGLRLRIANESIRTLTRTTDEVNRLRGAFLAMSAITGTGFTGAFAASYLITMADKAHLLNNQLRTVTDTEENLVAVRTRLYDISQMTRSSLEASTRIYARTARASESLGLSQEKLLRITESVQKAFAVGGATQGEATGAALQLSQAIASNRFSGDEFRSVSENAPVLMREMARSLGVNIGQLREMGQAGELTSETVTKAILDASSAIDKEFGKMTLTVGQGMTRLDNAMLQYIGDTDEAYGITRRLANALSNLAENFDEVGQYAGLAIGLGGTFAAGRIASSAARGGAGRIAEIRRERQEQIKSSKEELQAISLRRAEIAKEVSLINEKQAAIQRGVEFEQVSKVHDARERQYKAEHQLSRLNDRRFEKVGKITAERELAANAALREVKASHSALMTDRQRLEEAKKLTAEARRGVQSGRVSVRGQMVGVQAQRIGVRADSVDVAGQRVISSRIADQTAAVDRYNKSVGDLRAKMVRLSEASSKAFNNTNIRSYTEQIKTLDGRIAKAQKRLMDANKAYVNAQKADIKTIGALSVARQKAIAETNALQAEGTALLRQQEIATRRLMAAQRGLNIARSAGRSILGFLGGWTGVAFMGAIAGIAMYQRGVMKANEQTQRVNSELQRMGILADDTADSLDGTKESLEALASYEIKQKLSDINDEIDKLTEEQGFVDRLFNYNEENITNIERQIRNLLKDIKASEVDAELRGTVITGQQATDKVALNELLAIIQGYNDGTLVAGDIIQKMEEIGQLGVSDGIIDLIKYLDEALKKLGAYEEGTTRLKAVLVDTTNPYLDTLKRTADAYVGMQENRGGLAEMLTERDIELRTPELQRSIDKLADEIEKLAKEDGISITRLEAEGQARREVLSGTDVEKQVWDFFSGKGLQPHMVSAIMGNVQAESAFNPFAVGDGGDAHGLFQWNDRSGSLFDFIGGRDQIADVQKQLEFAWRELMTSENGTLKRLIASTDVASATEAFVGFERPSGWSADNPRGAHNWSGRLGAAQDAMTRYGGKDTVQEQIQAIEDMQKAVDSVEFDKLLVGLSDTEKSMLTSAQAAGATNDELMAFANALNSGNIQDLPERFRGLAESVQELSDSEFAEKLQGLRTDQAINALSELDQEVLKTARSFGVGEDAIQAYIAAVTSASMQNAPQSILAIKTAIESVEDSGLEDFADDVAGAFGDAFRLSNLTAQSFGDTLKDLGMQLLDIIWQLTVVEPLMNSIRSGIKSAGSGGGDSGGGGGGFLGSIIGALFPVQHAGGDAGVSNVHRLVPIAALPRFHDGKSGIGHDELLAVLQKTETVLTGEDTNRIGSALSGALNSVNRNSQNRTDVRVWVDEDGNWQARVQGIAQAQVNSAKPGIVKSSVRATDAAMKKTKKVGGQK